MLQAKQVSYFKALLSESHLEEHCEKMNIDQAFYKIDADKKIILRSAICDMLVTICNQVYWTIF